MARVTRIPVPDRGMNPAASILATSNNRQATRLVNFLPGYDRKLPLRGPIWQQHPGAVLSFLGQPGIVFNEGRRRTLFWDGSSAKVYEYTLGSVGSVTSPTTSTMPANGFTGASLLGRTYAPCESLASLPAAWQTRGYGVSAPDNLILWDGTTTLPTAISNGPRGVLDVIVHLDRVFALGGGLPGDGNTTNWDEKIYWTDVGGPVTNSVNEWKDDATALINQISLGHTGGNLIGFSKVNRNLVIFRYDGVQVLYGDTPSTFSLHSVLRGVGAYQREAITDFGDSTIFMSRTGTIYLYDGGQLLNLSEPLDPIFEFVISAATTEVSIVRLGTQHILVTLYHSTLGGSYLCHVPTRSWTQIKSELFDGTSGDGPIQLYQIGERALAWSGLKSYFVDDIIHPYRADFDGLGTPDWRTGRDFNGADYSYIPGLVEVNVQRMGNPSNRGAISRFSMDYVNRSMSTEDPDTFPPDPDPDDPPTSDGAFEVMLGDRYNIDTITNTVPLRTPYETQVDDNFNTPFTDTPLRLAEWDVRIDVRDARAVITTPSGFADDANEYKYMELGDMYVEWQETSQR